VGWRDQSAGQSSSLDVRAASERAAEAEYQAVLWRDLGLGHKFGGGVKCLIVLNL